MFRIQDTLCTHCNFCGDRGPLHCYAARTAHHGLEGNFPSRDENVATAFGKTQSAGEQFLPGVPRYKALRDVVLVPELLGTSRVAKKEELGGQEPMFTHCSTEGRLGGFRVKTPIILSAMGSTPVANSVSLDLGRGAARGGFVCCIGENILNMWGYEERVDDHQPSLKDRIRSFTSNALGFGGVVVQQNVEDARAGVWERVYNDPDLQPAIEAGLIGFEAKGGQGAKPGMGGEVKISRDKAQRLFNLYQFPTNPFEIEQSLYQRHSVPGTCTVESMRDQIRDLCRRYPKAKVWFKTGPYGDLMAQIQVLDEVAGEFGVRIHLTVDGTEGGTGMSPLGPMNEMGIPTLTCLQAIHKARRNYKNLDYTIAGGLVAGRDLAKALALGADGIAFGKAFLVAAIAGRSHFAADFAGENALAEAGSRGVYNYAIEGVTNEARMLVSSVGKYSFAAMKEEPYKLPGGQLSTVDVIALDEQVARMFDLLYAYDVNFWEKISAATELLRERVGRRQPVCAAK